MSDLTDSATIIVKQKYESPRVDIQQSPGIPLMQSFFNIQIPDNAQVAQMQEIYDWARSVVETDDELEILRTIKDARYRLADSSLSAIHRYARLRQLARSYEVEAQAMEK